jgi:hypothetical protein
MAFAKLSSVDHNRPPVYVNPDQVISVRGMDRYTSIGTAGSGDGHLFHISVAEDAATVVRLLEAAQKA